MRLIPVRQDLFRLFYLFLRAGEVKFEFSGSACDVNLDGGQPAPLHSQVELFVSFAYSVTLKTCHGSRVGWQQTESNGKRGVAVGWKNGVYLYRPRPRGRESRRERRRVLFH